MFSKTVIASLVIFYAIWPDATLWAIGAFAIVYALVATLCE